MMVLENCGVVILNRPRMGSFDEEIIAKPKMLVVMDRPSNDQREEVDIVKLADFL